MEGFEEKLASKLQHYSVLPFNTADGAVGATDAFILTNYTFFVILAFVATLAFMLVAARRVGMVPQGVGNVAEAGYEFIRNLCIDNMGREGLKYAPFIGTLFFFILFNNVIGLIPGALPGTGSIGVTAAWAVMVFIVYNTIGFKKNGFIGYMKSLVPSGVRELEPGLRFTLGPFIFILELVGHFLRPFTLAIRLYANMFAGGIILSIFGIFMILGVQQLGALGVTMTGFGFVMLVIMYAFKVLVAFIQAYVFAILTCVYIGGALHASEH
ncbi:MAG TPA: F0F1 ATP synthase subunit A [Coriobacteriia bacterium]|nr:F0F1 ATP synthase subunit A [Coriobacteriia bacterium]